MDAESVEAHPQHGFEISAVFFAIEDRNAVQEIRPGKQPARVEAGLGAPRLGCGRQSEGRRGFERIKLAIQSEECDLALEKIKDRIKEGLGRSYRIMNPTWNSSLTWQLIRLQTLCKVLVYR